MDAKTACIQGMVSEDQMDPMAKKLRDTYAITPGAPFVQREFGYLPNKWDEQGFDNNDDWAKFGLEEDGNYSPKTLGWCEAQFFPEFDPDIVEDRGETEVIVDKSGRHLLVFKGQRTGFMPEYLDHPVKDMKTWEEKCKWRMDPSNEDRIAMIDAKVDGAVEAAKAGKVITLQSVGCYMYLRSLMGPEDIMYKVYDMPELIHDCLQTWLTLADATIARWQERVTIDEIFFGEDICYNHGPLISPDMIREYLWPYYQQLLSNMKSRQLDKDRKLHLHIDTDGQCETVIPLYKELGMDIMSPFEVASGSDVVELGEKYPDLVMFGGIDKRELAKGKDAIDAMCDRILPAMHARGGYLPTCDHMVPPEVGYEDYIHYRKRCMEYA